MYEFKLYASENPAWVLFKPHTTPPSVTNFNGASIALSPNGDPASSHTYSQVVYDEHNDKLMLCGLGSAAGGSGSSFAQVRTLNLSSNGWDAANGALSDSGLSMFGAAFAYNSVEKAVYGRGGQGSGRWWRYDSVANTLTQLQVSGGASAAPNLHSSCAIDPVRRYGIWVGGYAGVGPLDNGSADMVLLDFSSRNGAAITGYARTLAGFPAACRGDKIGVEFHPPSGSFIVWAGKAQLYRLIPPANPFTGNWSFVTITPSGAGLPILTSDSYAGVFSKLRWCPYPQDNTRGVFIMDGAQGVSGAYSASPTTIYKPNF